MLRRRLLAALRAEPEIALDGLRLKFSDAKVRELNRALSQLEGKGLIEMHMPGRYRCLAQPAKPAIPDTTGGSGVVQPPSLARLMGRR